MCVCVCVEERVQNYTYALLEEFVIVPIRRRKSVIISMSLRNSA